MLIRVRMIGSGTEEDPWRASFPVYRMIGSPNAQGRVILEVPDRLAPEDIDAPDTPLRPLINGLPVLIGFRPAQRLAYRVKLHKLFDRIKDRIDVDTVE